MNKLIKYRKKKNIGIVFSSFDKNSRDDDVKDNCDKVDKFKDVMNWYIEKQQLYIFYLV